MTFDGKVALITGASRGLGAAAAVAFAERGTHVVAVARTAGGLEEIDDLIQAKGGSATLAPLDITDENAIKQLCMSIHERWGGVDTWLHTAIHAAPLCPTPHIDAKDWQKSIEINVTATARLIQNVEDLLRAKSGTAIHCADPVAGQKFFGTYGASKAAQTALFDSWAAETANADITIQSFTPKPMPTATRARFHPGENRDSLSTTETEAARLIAALS